MSNPGVTKLKTRASTILKQVFSAIVTIAKAKTMALKNKTSAVKARFIIFGLLRNKKMLMSAISHKIHALMGEEKNGEGCSSKTVMVHDTTKNEAQEDSCSIKLENTEEDNTEVSHSIFRMEDEVKDDDELDDGKGSVVDFVRSFRKDGSDFNLEDEIDHVADVFIKRFHMQMRMQKQESFKRYQEMMERSV